MTSATEAAAALMDWYIRSGVTTIEGVTPSNFADWSGRAPRLTPPPKLADMAESPSPTVVQVSSDDGPMPTNEAAAMAKSLAGQASTIDELARAIEGFDGCALKPGARNTVVFDGVPGAPLLVIGEAPGRDEDAEGKPFVGRAGQLLDRMLAAIGCARSPTGTQTPACITNAIYWRPPGNRAPTKAELAICLPFLERFIALSAPQAIVLAGNVPNGALFPGAPGITRARGKWNAWPGPRGDIPVLPMFHPAFLLRQPLQKRLAWADLLTVEARLSDR